MGDLIRQNGGGNKISRTLHRIGETALSVADSRPARWLQEILAYLANLVEHTFAKQRLKRSIRKEFRAIMKALSSGDTDSRLCYRCCTSLCDMTLQDTQYRYAFMHAFIIAYEYDSPQTVKFFADHQREQPFAIFNELMN